MNEKYLEPQTYINIIQELSGTIGNLYTDLALIKTQYNELSNYTKELENKTNELVREMPLIEKEEIINE